MKRLLPMVMLAVFGFSCATARLPPFAEPATLIFPVRVLDLPSGLRIVMQEDHSRPMIAVVSIVGVGAASDPKGQEGLAHFVEHLTFRSRPDGKIRFDDLLRLSGVSYFNAGTERDRTMFETVGPTEALASMIRLEGVRLLNPLHDLEPATVESERGVVMNELWQRDEAGQVGQVLQALSEALYPAGHPYQHGPGGTPASLKGLTLADAEKFVEANYRPRRMTLVIAGDLDSKTLPKLLDEALPAAFLESSTEKRPTFAANAPPPPPPAAAASVSADIPEPTLVFAWTLPGCTGPQQIRYEFLAGYFQAMMGGIRMFPGLARPEDIKAMSVMATPGEQASMLAMVLTLKKGADPEKVRASVLKRLGSVWGAGTLTNAYNVQKYVFPNLLRSVLVNLELRHESLLSKAITRAEDSQYNSDTRGFNRLNEDVTKISRDTLEELGKKYITPGRARSVMVLPVTTKMLAGETLQAPIAADDRVRARFSPEAFSAFTHPPSMPGWKAFQLSSGLEVVLVPRASSGMVAVTLAAASGRATGRLPAVQHLTRALVADRHEGVPSEVGAIESIEVGDDTTFIEYRGSGLNLANLLAMLSDLVKTQRARDYDWTERLKTMRDDFSREMEDPAERFRGEFQERLWAGTPYGKQSKPADLDSLRASDVNRWLGETFIPKGSRLVVVGDFKAEEAEPLVRSWMSSWTADGPPSAAPAAVPAKGPGSKEWLLGERDGAHQAGLVFGCRFRTSSPRDVYAASLLANELERNLRNFARDQVGGSYGFDQKTVFQRDGNAAIEVSGLTDNHDFARVFVHGRALWSSLAQKTFSDEEVSRARWFWSARYNEAYETSEPLAREVARARLAGEPADQVVSAPGVVLSLTGEELARVAKQCSAATSLGVLGDKTVLQTARSIQASIQK